ncbi:MAG: hypothetical protein ACK2UO_05020, partial [Caldilineaceae bacterium]
MFWKELPQTQPPCARAGREYFGVRFLVALTLVLSALVPGGAVADRWQVRPSARLETRYDDNVRFVRENPEAGFSARVDATFRAIRSTENSNTGIYLGLGGT